MLPFRSEGSIKFRLGAYPANFTPIAQDIGAKIGVVRPNQGAMLDGRLTKYRGILQRLKKLSDDDRLQIKRAGEAVRKGETRPEIPKEFESNNSWKLLRHKSHQFVVTAMLSIKTRWA